MCVPLFVRFLEYRRLVAANRESLPRLQGVFTSLKARRTQLLADDLLEDLFLILLDTIDTALAANLYGLASVCLVLTGVLDGDWILAKCFAHDWSCGLCLGLRHCNCCESGCNCDSQHHLVHSKSSRIEPYSCEVALVRKFTVRRVH